MQTRRTVLSGLAGSAATIAFAKAPAIAASRLKLIIIGGGPGGVTAAKWLAMKRAALDITLVERSKFYTSLYNSNFYLAGLTSFESLRDSYDVLRAKYGINVINENVLSIDRDRRRVILDSGRVLDYDRLIVAPGVELDYQSIPGWGSQFESVMPHAWQGADQIALLKAKVDAIEDGGVIVMVAPPNPYCCPPAPYERVSMIAHRLKTSGRSRCKIMVLDPKKQFAMQGLFEDGWENLYTGMVEWIDQSIYETIDNVDPASGTITTGFETIKNIALANIIPRQSAGAIARAAGLTNESGYCPIDPASMRSSLDANIWVVGDACDGGEMPKSAYGARCQAQIATASLWSELSGGRENPMLESVCWSGISLNNAVKTTGEYGGELGRIAMRKSTVSQLGESAEVRQGNWSDKQRWCASMRNDMFE